MRTRASGARHLAQQLPKISLPFEKAEGGAGEAAKKLKGNFGVAFAFQSSKSSSQSPFKKWGFVHHFLQTGGTRGASRIQSSW